jgi:hypothetical protein
VVAKATVNGYVHTTGRIHDTDQTVKVGTDIIIHADAQIIEERVSQQRWSTSFVTVGIPVKIGKVDPAHPHSGDIDV